MSTKYPLHRIFLTSGKVSHARVPGISDDGETSALCGIWSDKWRGADKQDAIKAKNRPLCNNCSHIVMSRRYTLVEPQPELTREQMLQTPAGSMVEDRNGAKWRRKPYGWRNEKDGGSVSSAELDTFYSPVFLVEEASSPEAEPAVDEEPQPGLVLAQIKNLRIGAVVGDRDGTKWRRKAYGWVSELGSLRTTDEGFHQMLSPIFLLEGVPAEEPTLTADDLKVMPLGSRIEDCAGSVWKNMGAVWLYEDEQDPNDNMSKTPEELVDSWGPLTRVEEAVEDLPDEKSPLEEEIDRQLLLLRADLVRMRIISGLSRKEVAARIGIARPSTIRKFEEGQKDVRLSFLRRYCLAIGVVLRWDVMVAAGDDRAAQ